MLCCLALQHSSSWSLWQKYISEAVGVERLAAPSDWRRHSKVAPEPRRAATRNPSSQLHESCHATQLTISADTRRLASPTLGCLLGSGGAGCESTPESDATVAKLLGEYAAVTQWDLSTRQTNEGFIRRSIKPALGRIKSPPSPPSRPPRSASPLRPHHRTTAPMPRAQRRPPVPVAGGCHRSPLR